MKMGIGFSWYWVPGSCALGNELGLQNGWEISWPFAWLSPSQEENPVPRT